MPLQFKHLLGAALFVCLGGDSRGKVKACCLMLTIPYSLRDVENAWYAFHLGFFVVPFFFFLKALLLKTCCLVLPGA